MVPHCEVSFLTHTDAYMEVHTHTHTHTHSETHKVCINYAHMQTHTDIMFAYCTHTHTHTHNCPKWDSRTWSDLKSSSGTSDDRGNNCTETSQFELKTSLITYIFGTHTNTFQFTFFLPHKNN